MTFVHSQRDFVSLRGQVSYVLKGRKGRQLENERVAALIVYRKRSVLPRFVQLSLILTFSEIYTFSPFSVPVSASAFIEISRLVAYVLDKF